MDFGFASVPAILVLVYLAGEIFKVFFCANESNKKYIPPFCGVVGLLLGVAMFYLTPTIIPCEDVFTAAAMGVVSGLAATGINQIGKQFANANTPAA